MEDILEARNGEEATQQISPAVSPQSVDSGRRKGKDMHCVRSLHQLPIM